jgi:Fe-Mn family superoxide dismutase
MPYHFAPLHCRPWTHDPRLIESHYEGNYGSAMKRLNAVSDELAALDPATASPETISRLKRDEAAALNSTLLHELYFASLGGDGRAVPEAMASALVRAFGSVGRWRKEFIALAEGLAGGSGWVLLTWLPRDGRLINQVGTDHSQSLSGGIPILAIDMYEHAYHIDFGTNATAYVAAFMRNIDWSAVQGRYEDAVKVAPPRPLVQKQFADVPAMSVEEVKAMLDSGERVQIIDARPRHYTTRAQDIMEGAVWRDPERLDEWIGELDKEQPGRLAGLRLHIGCQTAIASKGGFDARMAGGHLPGRQLAARCVCSSRRRNDRRCDQATPNTSAGSARRAETRPVKPAEVAGPASCRPAGRGRPIMNRPTMHRPSAAATRSRGVGIGGSHTRIAGTKAMIGGLQPFPHLRRSAGAAPAAAPAAEPSETYSRPTILPPDVGGRIEHMAIDRGRQRLIVAALGNGTVEAVVISAPAAAPAHRRAQSAARAWFTRIRRMPSSFPAPAIARRDLRCRGSQTLGRIDLKKDADNIRSSDNDDIVGYSAAARNRRPPEGARSHDRRVGFNSGF